MTAALLTVMAIDCAGISAWLAEKAHRSLRTEPEDGRTLGLIAACLLAAGLGCLIWSKGV